MELAVVVAAAVVIVAARPCLWKVLRPAGEDSPDAVGCALRLLGQLYA